jgi:hypothetical protein
MAAPIRRSARLAEKVMVRSLVVKLPTRPSQQTEPIFANHLQLLINLSETAPIKVMRVQIATEILDYCAISPLLHTPRFERFKQSVLNKCVELEDELTRQTEPHYKRFYDALRAAIRRTRKALG